MLKAVDCAEEEFAPFWSLLWRWRQGWRPVFFYMRGPSFPGLITGTLLSILGVWKFSRKPRRLFEEKSINLENSRVAQICPNLGSYGMGGPGFLGFRFESVPGYGSLWVVITLWSAIKHALIDGKPLQENQSPETMRKLSRKGREEALAQLANLAGSRLISQRFSDQQFEMEFEKSGARRKFTLSCESLRDAIIISSKAELWVV